MNQPQTIIQLLQQAGALKFGDFTLKSGRQCPYFINFGEICSGQAMLTLGQAYADVIHAHFQPDVIFGPAYKGIPLAVSTSMALSQHQPNIEWAFNRKEKKDHGEGGNIVGASVKGKKVVIIDDLITAGTAIRQSIELLKQAEADIIGIVIALDRQERGQSSQSAVQEISTTFDLPVRSILSLDALIEFIKNSPSLQSWLNKIEAYREKYGANN